MPGTGVGADLTSTAVEVRFTKLAGRRYEMEVSRERGPALAPRLGPGYDDHLPHEAVHFLVEDELGLSRGVYGRIAAGESNIFTTADPARRRHQARIEKKRRRTPERSEDMGRSEMMASICQPLWEMRRGLRNEPPVWLSSVDRERLASPEIERVMARLDTFARAWAGLDVGESVALTWTGRR